MSTYELTFILNDEAELKTITKLLETLEAKVLDEKKWEKRQLAYPIKKATAADYYTWKISIDEKQVTELKKRLNFNEKLLRYLMLKLDEEK